MKSKNGFIAAIVLLALALIASLIWGFSTNKKADELQTDNTEVNEALNAMTSLRDDLAREVDSLAGEYDILASENVELSGNLAAAQDDLAKAQAAVSRAKKNATAEINDLRAQIQELTSARANLLATMTKMEAENDSLRLRTGILETSLAQSETEKQELTQLTQAMDGEIKSLTYDNFRATAFQISPEVKRGNATSKSGRARRIAISFDLAGVPAEFQGVRPIYLVITDDTGTPIPRTDYIRTTVNNRNGEKQDIMAVESREENITASQRLEFAHELEEKLDEGYYRVSVFTDIGLLGSSTFRLR